MRHAATRFTCSAFPSSVALTVALCACGGASGSGGADTTREPSSTNAPPPPVVDDATLALAAAEARTLLDELRVREEAFRAEFGCYAASGDMSPCTTYETGPWSPPMLPGDGTEVPWALTSSGWALLGYAPSVEELHLQLRIAAGPPGSAGPSGQRANDHWFVATARFVVRDHAWTWELRSDDGVVRELPAE